jgi:PAS domain S-box-containing protein
MTMMPITYTPTKEQALSSQHSFTLTRHYARFLLKKKLDSLTQQFLQTSKEWPLSCWQHYSKHDNSDQQYQAVKHELEIYLKQLIDNTSLEGLLDSGWKAYLRDIPYNDFVDFCSFRKQALIRHLPQYTSDPVVITDTALELEKLSAQLQQSVYQLYTSIHQQAQALEIEEALVRSQSQLLEAQEMAHLGSWDWNIETDSVSWSDEMYRILGFDPGEINIAFSSFISYIHPEDKSKFRKALDSIFSIGKPYELQHRIISRDGATRWLISTGRLIMSDSGKPVRISGTGLDITDLKLIEEALQTNEIKFRTLFEKSGDAILLMNTKGFIDCNQAAVEMLGGTSQEEILMLHPAEISARTQPNLKDSYSKLKEMINLALTNGSCRFEWLCRRLDGQEFWSEILFTPIPLEGKTVIYAVLRNVSQRKEAEQELASKNIALRTAYQDLEKAQKKLKKANNKLEARVKLRTEELLAKNKELELTNEELSRINIDLDNFIYTASHDLKAPVSNLEGLACLLGKKLTGRLDETEATMMDMVMTSVDKLKKTIADLTEITKVQKEQLDMEDPISFEDLLADIKADIRCLIEEADARVTTHFEVAEITYARKNIRSILYNLLSNAIKYKVAERRPEITIRTRMENNRIVLSVSDNGLGIKEEQSHKLFKMFKRMHSHVEGSGIGLYIVKRIIENNGGEIKVESKPNEGSTFTVYFKATLKQPNL